MWATQPVVIALNMCETAPGTFCQIHVKDVLDDRWAMWFDDLQVDSEGDQTMISGPLSDQAAVHGVLNKIRDLGLTLVSVRLSDGALPERRSVRNNHAEPPFRSREDDPRPVPRGRPLARARDRRGAVVNWLMLQLVATEHLRDIRKGSDRERRAQRRALGALDTTCEPALRGQPPVAASTH